MSKVKSLSFPQRKLSNVVNLEPGCELSTWGNGALTGVQCWFLILTLSSSHTQVSFGKCKSMLLSLCIIFSLCHHGCIVHFPNGRWQAWLGKEADCLQNRLSYLIVKLLLCWRHLLMHIHKAHQYLYMLAAFGKIYPHIYSQIFFSPILNSCFFQVSNHPNKQLATAH